MSKMEHRHVFVRNDGLSIDALALVTITDKEQTPVRSVEEALSAMKKAVTDWVSLTRDGEMAYEMSCEDYNIGDMVEDVDDPSLQPFLTENGIESVAIQTFEPEAVTPFDEHLVTHDP